VTDGGTSPAAGLSAYRAEIESWLSANLPLREPGAELRGTHDITPEELARDRVRQKAVYDAGYLGITLPVEYGGQGLSRKHQQAWNVAAQAYEVPAPGGIASHVTIGVIVPTLLAHASEEQKRSWIPRMLSGEEIWAQLLSEPGAGSDLAGIQTRAVRDGDKWVLTGSKIWSSGAMCADYGICLARTDWDVPKHKGLTWFKVPLRDQRVTVRPVREINGSTEFCEEFLDGVEVGDDMVIGEVNGGWQIAGTMLTVERGGGSGQSAAAVPPGQRRLAPDLVELARQRGLTGDRATRQLIAKAHVNDYMQAQLAKRLAEAMMAGTADATAASLIKLGVGIITPLRAAAAIEIAGRRGVAWADGEPGEAVSINFLNGRILSIAGGSNQIQRNIISERTLGLPREVSADSDKPFREVLRDASKFGTKG
jgi:alkylation response protein AidB-like acyl-CoA dehydrogenase